MVRPELPDLDQIFETFIQKFFASTLCFEEVYPESHQAAGNKKIFQ